MCESNGDHNRIWDELEKIRMRQASGEVRDDNKLVLFLYLLSRDVMSWGEIENLLDDVVETCDEHDPVFTNGWAATWAQDAASRLQE